MRTEPMPFLAMNKIMRNSHQNSHSNKIKMAANLAASHLIDSVLVLAPQVGLEPTTLRLTAECSAIELLRSECATSLPRLYQRAYRS
jgi:hypothetical protein